MDRPELVAGLVLLDALPALKLAPLVRPPLRPPPACRRYSCACRRYTSKSIKKRDNGSCDESSCPLLVSNPIEPATNPPLKAQIDAGRRALRAAACAP